ncbi:MAG TPA: phosphodiester glycosidase family protein [Thermoleophilaceae bacterium]|nr:phosphodiester glycosidase family protein [Thermoleophilaceae bacterium]
MRAASLLAAAALLAVTPGASAAGLPLGPGSLREGRATVRIATGITWTRIVRSGGPWRVNVLTVNRAAIAGRVGAVLSNGRAIARERTSSMARRTRAIAGVNAGFFNGGGNPVGALSVRGRLVSEPVAGRSALLLPRSPQERPQIAPLRFAGSVSIGERTRLLDGVDRTPGLVPACGGRGGDRPTELPNATATCTDRSELVMFTRSYGAPTPAGGFEATLRGGAVTSRRPGGGSRVPRDGYVLAGSGDAARFLREEAIAGARPDLRLTLRAGARTIDPAGYEAIVSGGPRLLRNGMVRVGSLAEGFAPPGGSSFFSAFVIARNPRTLAGVRADGRLLLATIDGRRRGWSAGVSLIEAARVMRALGARDALNLDGGGSTTMTVGRRVVNRPSDRAGERAVSDGLFVLP